MPTLDSIYNKEQAKIGKFIAQFDDEADAVFKRVRRIATAQLAGLNTDNILSYEFAWRNALRDAGYYKMVNSLIDKRFNDMFDGTQEAFKANGYDALFSADDAKKIQIIKNMKRAQFGKLADDIGLSVKRELYKYAISDATLDDMVKGLEQTLNDSDLAKYSKTYALTAIGEFQQELIDLMGKGVGKGVWVYVGVKDDKTREYCSHILSKNKCYDDAKKHELERDSRRAYNCRHRFYKMKPEEAKASGYSCN